MSIRIEAAQNGYVLYRNNLTTPEVYTTLDELFERLLLYFEGKCDSFSGELYGKVTVEREQLTAPGKEDKK